MPNDRRTVTEEDVKLAREIRERGGKWSEVIAATEFNGATLRPYLLRAGYADASNRKAKVSGGKPTGAKIAADRRNSVGWYAITTGYGISEGEARKLAREGGLEEKFLVGRCYLSLGGRSKVESEKNGRNGKSSPEAIAARLGRAKPKGKPEASENAPSKGTPAERKRARNRAAAK